MSWDLLTEWSLCLPLPYLYMNHERHLDRDSKQKLCKLLYYTKHEITSSPQLASICLFTLFFGRRIWHVK